MTGRKAGAAWPPFSNGAAGRPRAAITTTPTSIIAGGEETRSAKTTDADAARRIANEKQADALRSAARPWSIRDLRSLPTVKRSVEAHLADYEAMLRVAGRTKGHITRTCRFVRDAAKAAGFEAVGDIAADRINHYGQELLKRRSARTVAAQLDGHQGFHVLAGGEGQAAERSPRQERPQAKFQERPADIAADAPARGMAMVAVRRPGRPGGTMPYERASASCSTPWRSKRDCGQASRSLTRGALFLSGERPYVTCKAGSTKNRKDARQYIRPELAKELRRQVAAKAPGAPCSPCRGKT